jgi:cardiolipin synthase
MLPKFCYVPGLAAAIFALSAGLTGCQYSQFSTSDRAAHPTGSVFGGQQPITGNLIQLYAVGTTADGSAAKPLISATVTTSDGTGQTNSNANAGNASNTFPAGYFTINGDYTCPSASTEVYLVGTGGNPGLGAGTNNADISLMAALGPCGNLSSSTSIVMNELTTIATVAPLSGYMNSYSTVGAGSADAETLQALFSAVNLYANVSSGVVPGPTLPAGFVAPTTAIQTLGDIVAACINSSGGAAGTLTPCGQLFTLATISGHAAPTDTVGAILNILKQPTTNVSQIYGLLSGTPPFQPTLSSTPSSWALPITTSTTQVSYTMLAFPESDNSVTPLYALVNNAQKTIDMTMYELQDTVFSGDLVSACGRGVKVRVVLSSSEKSNNAPAYAQINAGGSNCSAVYSNTAFTNTHQKTITIDGTTTAIMSLNLQLQYYSTTRDFALIENDPVDIAAIEATFNADYAAGTPSGGSQGPSDFSYQPGAGDDLIWSPTTAQADMLGIINNATKTLLVENEEMSASNIVSALVAACQRGVTVHVAMVNDANEYGSEFSQLQAGGCGVNVYPDTQTGFYIHAKVVIADYGLSTQNVYMGSINYSTASMSYNRELGAYISDPTSIQVLYDNMTSDYAGGTPY